MTYDAAETTFETSSGVRQGGPESPPLFTLYVDFVMRLFIERCELDPDIKFYNHKYRINARSVLRDERFKMRNVGRKLWGTSSLPWSGYADDLILFLLDQLGLQKATVLLDQIFTRFGLSINRDKTETMILNYSTLAEDSYPSSVIQLGDTSLKNVKDFKYLGTVLNFEEPNTGDCELNYRIQSANAKFAELSRLLQNHNINLGTRIKFLNSFVRSRLLYSCQNWNLSSAQCSRLDSCYRRFLRRMIRGGFKRIDGENDFRFKMSNDALHALCNTGDVSEFVSNQQKNYAAHIVRMPCERSVKKLMFNDDKCVRPGRMHKTLLEQVLDNSNSTLDAFCNSAMQKKLGKST